MKELILALLFLHPLPVIAGLYPCVFLDIQIKNQMQTACHLDKLKLRSGAIPDKMINDLPVVIEPGQMTDPFRISELGLDEIANLSLTYDCGENKKIMIESKKGLCRRNAVVTGISIAPNNVDVSYEASNGLYFEGKQGSITWTFKEIY